MDADPQHQTCRRRAGRQRSACLPVRSSRLLKGAVGLGPLVLTLDAGQPFDQSNLLLCQHIRRVARFLPISLLRNRPQQIEIALGAKLLQREPEIQARRDLYRFKQLMETGEVTTNAGPSGSRQSVTQPHI